MEGEKKTLERSSLSWFNATCEWVSLPYGKEVDDDYAFLGYFGIVIGGAGDFFYHDDKSGKEDKEDNDKDLVRVVLKRSQWKDRMIWIDNCVRRVKW